MIDWVLWRTLCRNRNTVGFHDMPVSPQFHCEERQEASDYEKLLAGPWELEYRQMSCGRFSASNIGITVGESVVYEEVFNRSVSIYGALGRGMLGFSFPNKLARLRGRWWGADYPTNAISFATGGREIDVTFPGGYRNILVLLPEQAFRAYYFDSTGEELSSLDESFPHLPVDRTAFSKCRFALKKLISMHTACRVPEDAVFSIVTKALASSFHPNSRPARCATPSLKSRRVREAIEIWETSRYELSIVELSRLVGVSQRTLEHGFRDQFNLTPYQYLIRCRLRFARDALREADPASDTVTDIAVRFGFSELGRFAGEYRRFFGELPSDTLAGRAGPPSSMLFG
jgi:AraC family ethanolamine operon transcriptional activator